MAETCCRIVDVRLDGPIEGYPSIDKASSVVFVFWLDRLPLGRVEVPAARLPITSSALAQLAAVSTAPAVAARLNLRSGAEFDASVEALIAMDDPLAQLSAGIATAPADELCVIVCTRGRPAHLERCLASLVRLDPAPGEIVVVGNDAPGDAGSETVVAKFPQIRFVAEPQAGLSRARNTGIASTRKPLIAFTDDDVVVAPNWAGAVTAAFLAKDVDGMTGLVLPQAIETDGQVYFELQLEALFKGFVPMVFGPEFLSSGGFRAPDVWMIGAGANMAFRRSTFEALGGFDVRLGAGASGCSEDSEFWYRMLAAGRTIAYRPECVVHHAHRASNEDMERQLYAYMRGHVAALFIQFARYGHWSNLRRAISYLPRHLARKAFSASRQAAGSWVSRFALAELRGCLAGLNLSYFSHRAPPRID